VQITANMAAGWTYLRVPDPGNGAFRLTQMRRADNSIIALDKNVWSTDRTFVGMGRRPVLENILHALDYNAASGNQTYTLVYEVIPSLNDTTPPTSQVLALPGRSPATFGVQWSADDDAGGKGLARVEVYVSDNGGPFARWLQSPTAGGAIFTGQEGHTYAFYSIALDAASNREDAPALADASTVADLINTAPTLTVAVNQTVPEGATVTLDNSAADADVPANTLTFSLGAGAPGSAVINSTSGRITWPTSETDGPSTNVFKVIVADNGVPPLSRTGQVTVIVQEVNSAPTLATITNRTVNEGRLLSFSAVATDVDLPTNKLTFSLLGAPSGATINATNGLFRWTPTETQGPSTNQLAVVVTDNGSPSLGATQHLSIIVKDVLSDFVLAMGSTNLMAGESNVVPVVLRSTLDLTNLTFTLTVAGPQIGNLVLHGVSPEVLSSVLQPAGPNRYSIALTLDPALTPAGVRDVARLGFTAVAGARSGIVPLTVSQLSGSRANGQSVGNPAAAAGQVIVVGAEPVLTLDRATPARLTIYGHPGKGCAIEYRTNLTSGLAWREVSRLTLASRIVPLTVGTSDSVGFYRAFEFASDAPVLALRNKAGPVFTLSLSGQVGNNYVVQTATNLGTPIYWSPLLNFTLTNSPQAFDWTNTGAPRRYFRALKP
jgi:hypothetical protein